jgi:hypothetical protein
MRENKLMFDSALSLGSEMPSKKAKARLSWPRHPSHHHVRFLCLFDIAFLIWDRFSFLILILTTAKLRRIPAKRMSLSTHRLRVRMSALDTLS